MNGASWALVGLGALALGAELRPRPTGPAGRGSADRAPQRFGLALLVAAGATALAVWPRASSASVSRLPEPSPDPSIPLAPPAPVETEPPVEARPPTVTPSGPSGPDDPFYRSVLRGIGSPVTPSAMTFLYAWRQAEGGSARYNPFNTTQKSPGSVAFNSVGVQHYPTPSAGVEATVKTLQSPRYVSIAEALRAGSPPETAAAALAASPWGTGALATRVLAGYAAGKSPRPPAIATTPSAPSIASLEPREVA